MPCTPRRRARAAAAALGVGLLLATAGVADAAVPRGRFGVGDSIMLSASSELADYGFDTNGEVGRRVSAGVGVVKRLATHDKLPRNLVVHLGTNGPVDVT